MLKSLPKTITILFLAIFIFQLVCLLFLTFIPNQAAAITFTPQVKGLDYTFNSADKTTGNIANYVRAIYKYAIGIVGILAAVVLMIGGVLWIVAGGNATAIGEAKSWIGASLTGLVLALMSYLILATVNPALVDLKTTEIKKVTENKITQSTLKENDPCVLNQAPYCLDGLECKDGKCAITSDRTAQCTASSYAWTESINCSDTPHSATFCSCKSGKSDTKDTCCTPKPATAPTTVLAGCCLSRQKLITYFTYCDNSIKEADCTSLDPNITAFFEANKKCKNITDPISGNPAKTCE